MQIRCADCGCLPSECKVALRRANVPIGTQRENIALLLEFLERIASFSEAEALWLVPCPGILELFIGVSVCCCEL